MRHLRSRAFTLTEVMIAVTISIVVFSAMASLLTRCFSMWVEAQAHWKLAQHARVTRTRLLYGGFGIGTGLLNATNVTVSDYGTSWQKIDFYPVTQGGDRFEVYGWTPTNAVNIWLRDTANGTWSWAQSVGVLGLSTTPLVMASDFSALVTNQLVTMDYTLKFSAMGKIFELPQTVEVVLVNE